MSTRPPLQATPAAALRQTAPAAAAALLAARPLAASHRNATLAPVASEHPEHASTRLLHSALGGTQGPATALPHLDTLQRSFGAHDLSSVRAHLGPAARGAARALGARAYALGHNVVFTAAPTLRGAAHEAAHVVQQRSARSWRPAGAVLGAAGSAQERHADQVAERVVRGDSVEALLDTYGPAGRADAAPQFVQRDPLQPAESPADKLISFAIRFSDPLVGREAFIDLAERTIYGRRIGLVWHDVKEAYAANESPVTCTVPLGTLRERLADYGEDVGQVIQGMEKIEDATTYQRLTRIVQLLTPAQWADFASRVTGTTTDLDAFEKAVKAYLVDAAQRETEHAARDELVSTLYGKEALYKRYRDWDSVLGVSSAEEAALQADLKTAGFPGGIEEFGRSIDDYLAAFRRETVRTGVDLMQVYDSLLYKEAERYTDIAEVTQLHAQLQTLREELPKFKAQADVVNRHEQRKIDAAESRRLPGNGGVRSPSKADDERAEAAGAQAEIHRNKAQASVQAVAGDFPVLAEAHLPLDRRLDKEAMAKADVAQLQVLLAAHIGARRGDVQTMLGTLTKDPDVVWSLDKLVGASLQRQQIAAGSIFEQMIQDHAADKRRTDAIIGVLVAVVAIALTVLSLGTGTLAAMAAVGALTLSTGLAVQQFKAYKGEDAAYGTGLLSDSPSAIWLFVAIVGVAVDMAATVKAVRAMLPLAEALDGGGKLLRFQEGLKALQKAGKIDARIALNAERAAAARVNATQAASSLGRTLTSRAYSFPGPLADPAVFKDAVRLAYYQVKATGLDFLKFADKMRAMRTAAKLGDFSNEELALLKRAYDEGRAFASEADLIKYVKQRPMGAKSIAVDENMLIARNKAALGETLQDGEKKMVEFLAANPDAKLTVTEELYTKVLGRLDTSDLHIIEGVASVSKAERTAVITTLEKHSVGATKGAEDRRLVADALLATVEPGVIPRFATHDPGIYNNLFRMTGGNPAKLGKSVAEAYPPPTGFDVVIEGRTLRVLPVAKK